MALVAGVLLAMPAGAAAQYLPAFEVRPMAGAYVPIGTQSDFLAGTNMYGAQASWLLTPTWALTGSFGWIDSQDKITSPVRRDVNLYQYDVGVEARVAGSAGEKWSLSPFIGLGVGGRTYDYDDVEGESRTFASGYGALGAEAGYDLLGLRFEARDYVSRFTPLIGTGGWDYRNDITLTAALNLRIW
jgi:hypothetical protein